MRALGYLSLLFFSAAVVLTSVNAQAQGVFLSGVGAVNRSMGSTAVAAPLDALGAININPATMAGLDYSQVELGLELGWSDMQVSSEVKASQRSGTTADDSGLIPIPAFAWVEKSDVSPWGYGFSAAAVAGFSADYPASTTNPILAPQQNGGLGHVKGSADFFQLTPAVSYRATPRTALGFSPTITLGRAEADPFVFTTPNADGSYPPGTDSNYRFGGGFQLGVYHECDSGINLGAAFKSKQWMEPFTINTTDERGLPRKASIHAELPAIASLGVSYTGFRDWVLASDMRYFDYDNAEGFKEEGFDKNASVRGLGWDSIFSFSSGVQYAPSEDWSLRAGYIFHQSPIDDNVAFYNVGAPLVIEHVLMLGASYKIRPNAILSLTWVHGFENSVQGPFISPRAGAVPGTSIKNSSAADSIALAITLRQ